MADKSTERKKLFEGGTSETTPKQRTIEEIKAKYRKAGVKIELDFSLLFVI